jgi:hypothetical protein
MQNSIIFLIAFTLFSYIIISPPSLQEKILYFSYCPDYQHNIYSCPKNHNIQYSKDIFKVFPKEQLVIFKDLRELKSCIVFDKNNWKCLNEMMKDGAYIHFHSYSLDEKDEITSLPIHSQITVSTYYLNSLNNFFKKK